jgi:acetyl-CoA carboxylase biotin carboxylase subunit
VRAAQVAGYVNAGTVEFLVDSGGSFYFLEVNARLQVEHPITELCTGIDLVKAQIAVAMGEPLPWRQDDVAPRGAAIECRIQAEDPSAGFVPATGKILAARQPSGPGVRLDAGYEAGDEVSPYYDSLLAKLCVWGGDRNEALARMRRALAECAYFGIPTTVGFHRYVFDHPVFVNAEHDTGFIARHWPPPEAPRSDESAAAEGDYLPDAIAQEIAVAAALERYQATLAPVADDGARGGWAAAGRHGALRHGLT